MDPEKKDAILKWQPPLTSAKQVRQFMGLVSYYRNFIPQLSTISEPLTRLTRKRVRLEWGWEAENAMKEIQTALTHAHTLTVWNEQANTRVTTDASDVGMGAILEQQRNGDAWKVVAAWS